MKAPGVVAGGVWTGGIVEQGKLVAVDSEGAETAPASVFVEDAVSALIEMQFPDTAFRQVVGAALAGNGSAFLGFNLGVKAVNGCGCLGWQGCGKGIGLLLQQFQPEGLCFGLSE